MQLLTLKFDVLFETVDGPSAEPCVMLSVLTASCIRVHSCRLEDGKENALLPPRLSRLLLLQQRDAVSPSSLRPSQRRFQTGPGRRPGRAGPHLQPGVRLGLVQRQRDTCCRRPGHMKAEHLPLPPHPPFPPPPATRPLPAPPSFVLPPYSLPFHSAARKRRRRRRDSEGSGGESFSSLLSFYSPSGEEEPLTSFPQQPGPLLLLPPWPSVFHCFCVQNCLSRE